MAAAAAAAAAAVPITAVEHENPAVGDNDRVVNNNGQDFAASACERGCNPATPFEQAPCHPCHHPQLCHLRCAECGCVVVQCDGCGAFMGVSQGMMAADAGNADKQAASAVQQQQPTVLLACKQCSFPICLDASLRRALGLVSLCLNGARVRQAQRLVAEAAFLEHTQAVVKRLCHDLQRTCGSLQQQQEGQEQDGGDGGGGDGGGGGVGDGGGSDDGGVDGSRKTPRPKHKRRRIEPSNDRPHPALDPEQLKAIADKERELVCQRQLLYDLCDHAVAIEDERMSCGPFHPAGPDRFSRSHWLVLEALSGEYLKAHLSSTGDPWDVFQRGCRRFLEQLPALDTLAARVRAAASARRAAQRAANRAFERGGGEGPAPSSALVCLTSRRHGALEALYTNVTQDHETLLTAARPVLLTLYSAARNAGTADEVAAHRTQTSLVLCLWRTVVAVLRSPDVT
eukprot:m.10593 g.10593  ORF g.10593 m.10593 type:complete len:456 (-) comp3819_c0_seq1:64-1431(-)